MYDAIIKEYIYYIIFAHSYKMMSIRFFNKQFSFPLFIILLLSFPQFNFEVKSLEKNIKESYNNASNEIINENNSDYLLGPGDSLFIGFSGIDMFSGIYAIEPDGNLQLPEVQKLFVSGLTPQELEKKLNNVYSEYIIDPSITVTIASFRPVNIYLSGEIKRPGLYTLNYGKLSGSSTTLSSRENNFILSDKVRYTGISKSSPKVFDGLVLGKGITKYADLKAVEIIRINSKAKGGGKIKAKIDILSILEKGDQSQNIVLRDGDNIHVPKSKLIIRDQLLKINQTNLTPESITIYINGNVLSPGKITLPQGSSLYEAVATVGGKQTFTGNIEFIRFDELGNTEKKIFKYKPSRENNDEENPLLANGDIIVVRKNILGKSTEFLREVSTPFITGFGLYEIFN